MAYIDNVTITRLGGFEGSDPELVGAYPAVIGDKAELINKALPEGAVPGTFRSDKIAGMHILSYTFKVKAERESLRDDLASISIIVSDKKVHIDQMEALFKEIARSLDESGDLYQMRPTMFVQMMERIYNGVNKSEKIKIDDVVIDIPQIIKMNKLNIFKKDLKEFQGAF
ncbi:MAG: hypothetical protein JW839_20515 [Candidatus Lokiarchaeota archaeon]|nr:hypothetical protein [Candidatus Lokiarchaeota archaeon]